LTNLKERLNKKELLIGSWITLGHPAIAEIMANAGFDWLAVDLEHSVISLSQAEDLIRVINLLGISPLVRLTSNNPDQIKRVMDAGSHGIIVPMVNTKDQAESAVNAAKYPPKGSRGFGLARAQGYGNKFEEYLNWEQNGTVVIVQIEHIDAINNIESILSVEGIDGFIIGPYDLSGSLGIPGQFEHPDMLEALSHIKEISKKMNIVSGIHIVEPDRSQLKQAVAEGQRFIAYSVDIRMLDNACRHGLEAVK